MIDSDSLPDNPTNFEKNISAFKKDYEKLYLYVLKFSADYLPNLYKKKDILTDYFL